MRTRIKSLKSVMIVASSLGAIAATALGLQCAIRSPIFVVRVVEVADQADDAPVDAQTITDLAAIPLGRVNLFDLDLKPVEKRLLANPWVREAHLMKRFPQTVAVSIDYRQPKALLQNEQGTLTYVDAGGIVFGEVSLLRHPDLPVLTGFHRDSVLRLAEALNVLSVWDRNQMGGFAQISSLSYDPERGFRAMVTYPLSRSHPTAAGGKGRAMLDLGHDIDGDFDPQLRRLKSVFQYLSGNGVSVRQVYADAGKKIVVRIAHGS